MLPAADPGAKGIGRARRQEKARHHRQHRAGRHFDGGQDNWPANGWSRALLTHKKLEREAAVKAVTDEVGAKLVEKFGAEKVTDNVLKEAFYYIQKETVRGLIMNENKRLDGRGFDDIRPIICEVGILPRAHGSALFSRGETQAVTLVTLGTTEDAQEFDSYTGGETQKKFILHYNFPNYSVGETGRISGPGRREIGHGALAERSIEPMLPAGHLSLRHPRHQRNHGIQRLHFHGHRLRRHPGLAGRGRAHDPARRRHQHRHLHRARRPRTKSAAYKLLTDIIGWEDGFLRHGLQNRRHRKGHHRLSTGPQAARPAPRTSWPKRWKRRASPGCTSSADMADDPRRAAHGNEQVRARASSRCKINPEKIGALIGPGGKNIKRLVEESGCEINIDDDGTVNIYSVSAEGMKIARDAIEGMTAEAEIGKIYRGKVVTIKEFGAFVEFLPGKDGLVHISELANFRVKQTEDIVKMGDEIWVKCLGVDEKGRVRLSRKAAMEEREKEMAPKA